MNTKPSIANSMMDFVVTSSLCILLFAFIFGMPWLDIGLWPQTEGPTILIHAITAITSIAAGVQLGLNNPRYIAAAKSPIVITLFAFSVFSAILLVFIDSPLRSLHGTLKHGIGVLWHLELTLFVFAAKSIWPLKVSRNVLISSAGISTGIVCGLYFFPAPAFGVPLDFVEWVGILCMGYAGIIISSKKDKDGNVRLIDAAIICAIGYYLSENRAVILAVAVMLSFWSLKFIPKLSVVYTHPLIRSSLVVLIVLAGAFSMYVAAPNIESYALTKNYSDKELLSNSQIDLPALHNGAMGTIWSRSYMIRILKSDIEEKPSTLLTGNGFGSFASIYEHHVDEVPGRRFSRAANTASNSYWDVHDKSNFHSHNVLAENLISVGIIGAILWIGVLIALAMTSPAGALVAIGFAVISTFWFPINHLIGIIAILFAASTQSANLQDTQSKVISGLSPILTILIATLFGFTSFITANLAITERQERAFTPLMVDKDISSCGFIRADYFHEPEITIDLYTILENRILRAEKTPDELFHRTTNILTINCMLRRYFETEGNMRSLVTSLETRESITKLGKYAFPAMAKEIKNWSKDVHLLLENIPERTEFIPPFLEVLLKYKPELIDEEVDGFLPLLNDDDPVREYIIALRHLTNKEYIEYRTHMQRAVDLGYANLRYVPLKTADAIGID